jgi:2-polyprenyl-3-methyl-5-hydroxy-6-metoxy-1,4-benzoquinol methylase
VRDLYESYGASGFGSYSVPTGALSVVDQYEMNLRALLPADPHAAMLDIGCGAGHLLTWLQRAGYDNALGVDVSEGAVAHCHASGLPNVERITDLTSFLAAKKQRFDLITMNDVVEHIAKPDTVATLAAARAALAQSGKLVVKTLNMGNVGALYLRYADFTHEVGFTETSLRQVLLAAGFANVRLVPYRVPARTLRTRIWRTVGQIWQLCFQLLMFLDIGTDAPSIRSKMLLAIAEG